MKRNPRETAPKTARPKCDGCHFLAQVGKSASDQQPIRCHASSAESTLMFAAAIIAGIDVNDAEQMDGAELQL